MAGKAIFRISKLKSFVAIAGAERHNRRTRTTPNADPDRRQDNFTFMGDADRPLVELARERIGEQKIRKNALLAIEVFISASPEYFRPDAPEQAGDWERGKFEAWLAANAIFLEQEFGPRRILRAECHLDESTPHIHAVIVPLTDQGKLSYRQLYGGKRTQLSELQDRAWLAVAELGIERGQKGSQAQHQTVQAWYATIQQPLGTELEEETVRVQLLDRARLERENAQLKQQAAALSQTLEKRNQEKQTLLQQNSLMQEQLQTTQTQIATWKEKYSGLVDPLRVLPLEKVAAELCLRSDEEPQPTWWQAEHQIRINGLKFYDWHERQRSGGGGAIDLVMHVHRCDFKSAVAWLADRFGEEAVTIAGSYHAQEAAELVDVPQFEPPIAVPKNWAEVRSDLAALQLPGKLIDQLHEQGFVYADRERNIVFLQRDFQTRAMTGAYVQREQGFSGMAVGSALSQGRFYWLRGGKADDPVERVVVGQTPIDALAIGLMQAEPKVRTMYLSADGVLPLGYLQSFSPKCVRVALNRDEVGQRLAQVAREELPQVKQMLPEQVDWVQSLQASRQQQIQQQLRRVGGKGQSNLELD